MSQSLNRVKVKIGNEEYTVISTYSNVHVNVATELLNEQLEQLEKLSPELDENKRVILLALNTVSKQIVLEQEIQRLNKQIKKMQIESVEKNTINKSATKNEQQRLIKQKDLFARQTNLEDFSKVFTAMHMNDTYRPALFNQEERGIHE